MRKVCEFHVLESSYTHLPIQCELPGCYAIADDMADDAQALRAAARHGRLDDLKACLEKGMNVNVTDEDGATPLLMACCYGHTSCVDVLLKANADPNVAGKHGITPVFFTCQENHPSCLKLLIARGANLDTPNSQDGGSPLYIACSKNNVECLRMLCEAGADVNKPRVDGSTGLQTAMRKKHKECVKLCIQYGAEIDKGLPPANKTPFQMAMDMVYAGDSKMRRSYLIGMLEQHEKRDLIAANEKLKAKVKELEASGRAFALKTPTTPILLPTPEPKKGKKSTSPKGGKKSDEEDGPTSAAPPSDTPEAVAAAEREAAQAELDVEEAEARVAAAKAKLTRAKAKASDAKARAAQKMALQPKVVETFGLKPLPPESKRAPSAKELDLTKLMLASALAVAPDMMTERDAPAKTAPDTYRLLAPKIKFPVGSSVFVKRSNGSEDAAVVKSYEEKSKLYTLELGKAGSGKEKQTHEKNMRAAEDLA